jgi:hypothetical protein
MKQIGKHTQNIVDCINIAANNGHKIEYHKAVEELLALNPSAPEEGVMTFWMGGLQMKGHINQLKEWVDNMEFNREVGQEYPKHMSDCMFAISVAYQSYYDLDENDWSTPHNETELEKALRLGVIPE